jgi:hypothetical protein
VVEIGTRKPELVIFDLGFDRTQQYLLPPSVDEWLPEGHLARFIVEVIDQLDLSKLRVVIPEVVLPSGMGFPNA